MPAQINVDEKLQTIFTNTAESVTNHRRSIHELKKLQLQLVGKPGTPFESAFWKCLLHIFKFRKGTADVDRHIIRFLESYFDHMSRSDDQQGENAVNRLMEFLMGKLRTGFNAKSSVVRYRGADYIPTFSDDTFEEIREELLGRARDKDASVRVQATYALTRIQGEGDEVDEGILATLLEMMAEDASADVRKCLIWNIGVTERTIDSLLERVSDVDVAARRFLYKVMAEHYQIFSPERREYLVRHGMKDREPSVVKRCREMVYSWWQSANTTVPEFIRMLQLRNSLVADEVLVSLISFAGLDENAVSDESWESLTPESALYLRNYLTCLEQQTQIDKIEEIIPALVDFTALIEKHASLLLEASTDKEVSDQDFISQELLRMCKFQDFSDEVGRRAILACLRDLMLAEDSPPEFMPLIVTALRLVAVKEADSTAIIAEILCGIQDDISNQVNLDDTEREMKELLAFGQSLEVIRATFELLEKPPYKDPAFDVLLHRFVLQGVRSTNMVVKGLALHCLGLACTLDKTLAIENANLFLFTFEGGSEEHQILCMKILFDIVMVHGANVFDVNSLNFVVQKSLGFQTQEGLTVAIEGVTKLMIQKHISDPEVLQALVVFYFHPHLTEFHRLRQCLSYFLPIFCFSSYENQAIMSSIFVSTFLKLVDIHPTVASNGSVAISDVAGQLVEWTDTRRLVLPKDAEDTNVKAEGAPMQFHGPIAIDLMESMQGTPKILKEGVKILNLLHFDASCGKPHLQRMIELAGNLRMLLTTDYPTLKALAKFEQKVAVLCTEQNAQ
ncbi:hypothetical protein HDV05_002082 [Chytridiales sp. JEL 0842]|nr:hypothetical protein HDV05_002082 [Chytridiales sp. JEL 0842]